MKINYLFSLAKFWIGIFYSLFLPIPGKGNDTFFASHSFQEENSDEDEAEDEEASKSSVDSNEKTDKADDESKSRSGSRSSTSAPGWFGKGRKFKKQRIWLFYQKKMF